MKRPNLRRFSEVHSDGERTGLYAYVVSESRLPRSENGTRWIEDRRFNEAAELASGSGFHDVVRTALTIGLALVKRG